MNFKCEKDLSTLTYVKFPGDGGSHLEAKLNKSYSPRYLCEKYTESWYNIWLNLELLMPYAIDCWVDNVKLGYDNDTRLTSNTPGVNIRVPNFGNTTSIEWLDPTKRSVSKYFATITQKLVSLGLIRGKTIRGAPYDFRKTPIENVEMMHNMKTLIEEMYNSNGKLPVVIICHSMGCSYTKYFLQTQSLIWKKTFLKAWVTLSAPWAGTVKALKIYASGDNLDAYPLNALKIRDCQRTFPSLSWLLPHVGYWQPNQTLISTPLKNYSLDNIETFFFDLGLPNAYEMWFDNKNLMDLMDYNGSHHHNSDKSIGVMLHCLHGISVPTPELLKWNKPQDFPDKQPLILQGDGDGSVNLRSLSACLNFYGSRHEHKNLIIHKTFPGVEHVHILYNNDILQYIQYVVTDGYSGSNLSEKMAANFNLSKDQEHISSLYFPLCQACDTNLNHRDFKSQITIINIYKDNLRIYSTPIYIKRAFIYICLLVLIVLIFIIINKGNNHFLNQYYNSYVIV
ncbi:phospholipase A2 group XV-like isoform X2 [Gordionus sp. m RMFG-2023]|uniref:phospholipase A2 group XV-like isoform X2 n=1 Tax=Gordionus sp. m RMFG-2023 TaxID=3053472 RepID=UPI0031FDA620